MKFNCILLLTLSVLLSSCSIYKKRYSRGFTIERNKTYNKVSPQKDNQTFNSSTPSLTLTADETPSTDSTFIFETEQEITKIIDTTEPLETKSNSNPIYTYLKNKKKLNHSITPLKTNYLKKIKTHASVVSDKIIVQNETVNQPEKNNVYGIIGVLAFVFALIVIGLVLLNVLTLSLIFLIGLAVLSFVYLYVLLLLSFLEMIKGKIRNKWVSVLGMYILSFMFYAICLGLVLAILLSLSTYISLAIIFPAVALLIFAILYIILFVFFVKSDAIV